MVPRRIAWTDPALDDLEAILRYYRQRIGTVTAKAVENRIVGQIERWIDFPERVRTSDRVPDAREVVIQKLPYIAFVQVLRDRILVLNVVHMSRKFPTKP